MAENIVKRGAPSIIGLPWVSVVVPCLNRDQFLVPTIESVLQQDYPHIECIVVDEGSTDGTIDVLRRYDGRLRWLSEPDGGPPDAINKGWRICNGDILAWLNADDLWAPGAVRKAVDYFNEHPEADVVYGNCGIIGPEGEYIKTISVRNWDLRYAAEHCDHILFQPATFMRRSILERVGWLYPQLCHDHDLWLRIGFIGGKFDRIPEVLGSVRRHADDLGCRSNIIIPLKLDLTKRFFSQPNLPESLAEIENRALSNAYLRGIDFVFFDSLSVFQKASMSLNLIRKAFRADSSNIIQVVRSLLRLAVQIPLVIVLPYLPNWVVRMARQLKHRMNFSR